jgi:hypothetical protein
MRASLIAVSEPQFDALSCHHVGGYVTDVTTSIAPVLAAPTLRFQQRKLFHPPSLTASLSFPNPATDRAAAMPLP